MGDQAYKARQKALLSVKSAAGDAARKRKKARSARQIARYLKDPK